MPAWSVAILIPALSAWVYFYICPLLYRALKSGEIEVRSGTASRERNFFLFYRLVFLYIFVFLLAAFASATLIWKYFF